MCAKRQPAIMNEFSRALRLFGWMLCVYYTSRSNDSLKRYIFPMDRLWFESPGFFAFIVFNDDVYSFVHFPRMKYTLSPLSYSACDVAHIMANRIYVLNNTNTTAPKSPNTFTVVCVVLTFKWVFYVPLVIAHSHTHTWNTTKVFNVSFWNVGFNFYSEYYTTSILQTFDTCATFSVYQCIRNSVK